MTEAKYLKTVCLCGEPIDLQTDKKDGYGVYRCKKCISEGSKYDPDKADQIFLSTASHHSRALKAHSKALAAHCECLAMNAENMWAAIVNESPKYLQKDYEELMRKWGLIDEEGKPLI